MDGRNRFLIRTAAFNKVYGSAGLCYRGAGKVRFDPDIMSQRLYGKPATLETRVSFAVPGAYRLRAIASDGQTFSTYDVDVTV